jgi:putative transcriptional regulator
MSVSRHLRHEIPLHVNRLAAGEIGLFVIYAENFRDNIRGQARRLIKEVIEHGYIGTETARARHQTRSLGQELLQSVCGMKAGRRGRCHHVKMSPIVEARQKSELSQAQFARLRGVSVRTVQDWEPGRREPSGAAQTLILIAARRPGVRRSLAAQDPLPRRQLTRSQGAA